MLGLMRLDCSHRHIGKLRSVLHYSGLPIDARSVTDEILVQEGRKPRESVSKAAASAAMTGGE